MEDKRLTATATPCPPARRKNVWGENDAVMTATYHHRVDSYVGKVCVRNDCETDLRKRFIDLSHGLQKG